MRERTVIVSTPEDLTEAIREAAVPIIEQAVERALRKATMKPYQTRSEAAELLAVSVRKIDYLREAGKIPHIKRGQRVLFPTAALIAYAEEGRINARRDER
jgi:excisionase family DNA binding protein